MTVLDVERHSSGELDTNELVLELTFFVYDGFLTLITRFAITYSSNAFIISSMSGITRRAPLLVVIIEAAAFANRNISSNLF